MNDTHDPYRALRNSDFKWLLVASTFTFVAAQMQSLVLGWQVYQLTHQPLALGWMGLVEAAPFLSLTLYGGTVADRFNRRAIVIASSLLSLAGAVALAALFQRHVYGGTWPLYAVQALAGVSRAFSRPAAQALGTELIPRDAFESAATWRSSTFHLAMVAGPALGGLLYGLGGPALAFDVIAILVAFGCGSMLLVRYQMPQSTGTPRSSDGLATGVRFVFSHRLILSALSLDLFAVLFGGAIAMLPAFAHDVLRVGPSGLGLMRSAPAVGAIGMSLIWAYRAPSQHAGRALLTSVAAFGLCWIAFAYSRSLSVSLLLLTLSGAVDNVSVILRATLVQTYTPRGMMGRVQAVNGFFIGSSNEIGAFESGLAANYLGLVRSVVFGGCMTLLVVAAVACYVPELRRLKRIVTS